MNWFKVPATVWLEADNDQQALADVMAVLPPITPAGQIRMADGGPAVQLNPEQIADLKEFLGTINRTLDDAEAGRLQRQERPSSLR